MFAGAQIVAAKLASSSIGKGIVDKENDDKIAQDLVTTNALIPRAKATIVIETPEEKLERKALAQERKNERILEQQKIVQHMENLVEKALQETPLSTKEETNLRNKIKSMVTKVNKESDEIDSVSRHPSGRTEIPPSTTLLRIKSNSTGQSLQTKIQPQSSKTDNEHAFVLWYDKNIR